MKQIDDLPEELSGTERGMNTSEKVGEQLDVPTAYDPKSIKIGYNLSNLTAE